MSRSLEISLVLYVSSVLICLSLTVIMWEFFNSHKPLKIKGKEIRMKHPIIGIVILIVLSFLPIINSIVSYMILKKTILE